MSSNSFPILGRLNGGHGQVVRPHCMAGMGVDYRFVICERFLYQSTHRLSISCFLPTCVSMSNTIAVPSLSPHIDLLPFSAVSCYY